MLPGERRFTGPTAEGLVPDGEADGTYGVTPSGTILAHTAILPGEWVSE